MCVWHDVTVRACVCVQTAALAMGDERAPLAAHLPCCHHHPPRRHITATMMRLSITVTSRSRSTRTTVTVASALCQ
eukprot:1984675-Rhodomonas_salina.3